MAILEKDKKTIDSMDYRSLLSHWRFAPIGSSSSLLQGETGKYYSEVMSDKKSKLAPGEAAIISKEIGW
jgi:hypothetical protein